MEAGITNEETLRQLGAKTSWLKMRSKNKALSIRYCSRLKARLKGYMKRHSRRIFAGSLRSGLMRCLSRRAIIPP